MAPGPRGLLHAATQCPEKESRLIEPGLLFRSSNRTRNRKMTRTEYRIYHAIAVVAGANRSRLIVSGHRCEFCPVVYRDKHGDFTADAVRKPLVSTCGLCRDHCQKSLAGADPALSSARLAACVGGCPERLPFRGFSSWLPSPTGHLGSRLPLRHPALFWLAQCP